MVTEIADRQSDAHVFEGTYLSVFVACGRGLKRFTIIMQCGRGYCYFIITLTTPTSSLNDCSLPTLIRYSF